MSELQALQFDCRHAGNERQGDLRIVSYWRIIGCGVCLLEVTLVVVEFGFLGLLHYGDSPQIYPRKRCGVWLSCVPEGVPNECGILWGIFFSDLLRHAPPDHTG